MGWVLIAGILALCGCNEAAVAVLVIGCIAS